MPNRRPPVHLLEHPAVAVILGAVWVRDDVGGEDLLQRRRRDQFFALEGARPALAELLRWWLLREASTASDQERVIVWIRSDLAAER